MNKKTHSTICFQIPDHPLNSLGKDDPFQFKPLVGTFVSMASHRGNKTPYTVVIDGPWGSGKTTLMKMIRARLDEKFNDFKKVSKNFTEGPEKFAPDERPCKTFWFNAWKYSKDDTLMTGLLLEMFKELENESSFWDALKTKIDTKGILKNLIDKLFDPISKGDFTDGIYQLRLEKRAAFLDEFSTILKNLINHFGKLDKDGIRRVTFVIFIDDLDRCPPSRVLQVLETIKLFLDMDGCIFFLGMELDRVVEAIQTEYVEKMKLKHFEGDRYLQKIIQVHVKIPEVEETKMDQYFQQIIGKTPELETILDDEIRNVFLKENIKTQRALIRQINDFLFLDTYCAHMGVDLSRTGLAKWVVLRTLNPKFSKMLFSNLFYLAAWEAYTFRKSKKEKKVDTFNWDGKMVFHWSEWKKWEKAQTNKNQEELDEKTKKLLKNKLYQKWHNFYEEWKTQDWFENALFLTIGGKDFKNKKKCESFQFLNQVMTSDALEVEVDSESEKPYPVVRGYTIKPGADLARANLSGANLKGANLSGADLSGAKLRGSDLKGAFLARANLEGADLWGAFLSFAVLRDADLRRADLSGANLEGAELSGANLEGADLLGASLSDADLRDANLSSARFQGAKVDPNQILKSRNWNTARFSTNVANQLKQMEAEVHSIEK